MAKKPSALASIFDDEPDEPAPAPAPVAEPTPAPQRAAAPRRSRRAADTPAPPAPAPRSSHPGKKPVLIHIPEDMHRALRQLSVEEGGEPLTVITERLLRQYLVTRGHTKVRAVSKRRDPNPEFDLFIPALGDLPLRDQREVMERPFFSLQKRKRLKPIEYRSPDGEAWVRVQAIPDYGMATIWDADILIWAASTLNRMKQQGLNDLPRTLTTTPYDLLRAIKRSTGGRDYQELQAALLRLQTTSITTSIRATKRRQKAGFNWLDSWTFDTDADTEQPRGMTLTLSDWVYEGIVNEKSLLTMHPDYFLLSGGLERALYRIARKHVGTQRGGWLCRVEVLRDKTGSDAQPKEFNRMLRRVIEADQLPDYAMETAETTDKSPAVLFRLRGEAEALALAEKMRAEDERRARVDADRRHAEEVDARMDRLADRR